MKKVSKKLTMVSLAEGDGIPWTEQRGRKPATSRLFTKVTADREWHPPPVFSMPFFEKIGYV